MLTSPVRLVGKSVTIVPFLTPATLRDFNF